MISYDIIYTDCKIINTLRKRPPSGKFRPRLDDSARFLEENPIPAARSPNNSQNYVKIHRTCTMYNNTGMIARYICSYNTYTCT